MTTEKQFVVYLVLWISSSGQAFYFSFLFFDCMLYPFLTDQIYQHWLATTLKSFGFFALFQDIFLFFPSCSLSSHASLSPLCSLRSVTGTRPQTVTVLLALESQTRRILSKAGIWQVRCQELGTTQTHISWAKDGILLCLLKDNHKRQQAGQEI